MSNILNSPPSLCVIVISPVVNLLALKDEKVTSVISVKEFKDYLMMATRNGVIKKIELSQFANPRKGGIKQGRRGDRNHRAIA